MKRIALLSVSVLILGLLVLLSGPESVAETLLGADPLFLFLGLLLWFSGYLLRTVRWKFLLERCDVKPDFPTVMKVYASGLFLSNLSPGKVGDPARNLILKKVSGYRVGRSLPSLVFERLSDVIVTLSLAVWSVFVVSGPVWIWILTAVVFYFSVFAAFLLALNSEGFAGWLTSKISGIVPFPGFGPKFEKFLQRLKRNLKKYGFSSVVISVLLSFPVWVLDASVFYISFLALGLEVELLPVLTLVPLISLVSILTMLPGGLGSSELLAVVLFTSLYPLSPAEVTAAALLSRLLSSWPYALLGSAFLSSMKYRYEI